MDEQRYFIQLLLDTSFEQQIALVATATESQIKALVEIAYNLPKLTDLGPHQKFLTYLGNQKHTLRYKKSLLKNHAGRFVKAINTVREQLLELVK